MQLVLGMSSTTLLLLCSLGVVIPSLVCGEMFTALVHMEGLVELEEQLVQHLKSYIRKEEERLGELKKFLASAEHAQSLPRNEPREHLYHPTNALAVIMRYHSGWDQKLSEYVYQDNSHDLMSAVALEKYRFPSKEDYSGAVTAIIRLQDAYKISPRNLTQSILGERQAIKVTTRICFEIGREAYYLENYWHTKEWMLECLRKMDEENDYEDVSLPEIYDFLAFSEYKVGNLRKAMQYTKDILQSDPTHERALSNFNFFSKQMKEDPEAFNRVVTEQTRNVYPETLGYEELCREAKPIPKENHHKMVCFYFTHKNNPRLILRPIKVEVAHLKPRIWIFKKFLSETEMARLRELAVPKLKRATARNWKTGEFEPADYRISKSGWLSEDDDESTDIVHRINNRIDDSTGLSMATAEDLQVVNYGIGGHYEPHYDFARKNEDAFSRLGWGNRISTLLIYMSNVTLGGATVFTESGGRIIPYNGDAVYWWNLKRSGEGDMRTRHAACPVLVGTKWVCNKWIHEAGQEFRRPCLLNKNK